MSQTGLPRTFPKIAPIGAKSTRVLAALGLLLGSLACQPEVKQPRLVLLYATCSLNRHFLGPYDSAVSYTPNIDRLGKESVVFRAHHTEAGQSGTSYASIFSGTQAMRHGIYDHPRQLPSSLFTAAEAFEAHGYRAFGFEYHFMASGLLNYMQGVHTSRLFKAPLVAGHEAFVGLLDRLEKQPDFRAFVVTNFSVTHYPYGMLDWGPYGESAVDIGAQLEAFCGPRPEECKVAEDREEFERLSEIYYSNGSALRFNFEVAVAELGLSPEDVSNLARTVELIYKLAVVRLDSLFGAVLRELEIRGLLEETLIAFTSDHGEILYRENALFHWTHGYQLAPEVIGVPLLMRIPGVAPRDYSAVTRSIDVFPTLLGLSGLPFPADHVQGVDLSAEIRSGGEREGLLAFSHTDVLPQAIVDGGDLPAMEHFGSFFPRRDPELMWVSVRSQNLFYKLLRLGPEGFTPFVFDLEEDPTESTNLFDRDDAEQQTMFAKLEEYRRVLLESFGTADEDSGVPRQEQIRLLRSLGYIE
jgi:arylsulfatase A-like enzyme